MKFKKILMFLFIGLLAFAMFSCVSNEDEADGDDEEPIVNTYTVIFESEGERHATAKVKDGQTITATISNPAKDGHSFVGWYEGETLVDLATYVVTKDVTLQAHFKNDEIDDSLNVNAVKEADHTYTLVIGWWEVKDPEDPTKQTSFLTEELVKKFYTNVNLYLKVKGLSAEEIANVQVRNYSTAKVDAMGALVNADADVDIMIGVGNNINSTAGVSLYEGSNDNKFATLMGTTPTNRYVALTSYASELGVNVWDWLYTEVGRTAFNTLLTESQIVIAPARTKDVNVDVNVHVGEEATPLHFATVDDKVSIPEFTAPAGYEFKGFALSAEGEVVLTKGSGAELVYNDVKALFGENTSIDLYPIFAEIVIVSDDLVVYVQVNGANLTMPEAKLLEARYLASLTEAKQVKFVIVDGNADVFTAAYNDADCVDVVVGGNSPLKNFAQHAEGALVNAGAQHFKSTNRKVIISANCQHLDMAKDFYNFVAGDAPVYEAHVTFWLNNNTWITVDELAAIKTALPAFVKAQFNLGEEETMEGVYNVVLNTYDAEGTKVAALATETNALRDGKGTDLIIGCGANVTTTGGYTDALVCDMPATMAAAGRKAALITSNYIAMMIFDGFFTVVEETPAELI